MIQSFPSFLAWVRSIKVHFAKLDMTLDAIILPAANEELLDQAVMKHVTSPFTEDIPQDQYRLAESCKSGKLIEYVDNTKVLWAKHMKPEAKAMFVLSQIKPKETKDEHSKEDNRSA